MHISELIENTCTYNITKAVRRIYFINQKPERTSKEFKADYVSGSGTGIVFKIDEKYFILTAKHVIQNTTGYIFQNNSPFWFSLNHSGFINEKFEILYPGKIWFIGDLINEEAPLANMQDAILIEAFPPLLPPDHFIDIKDNFFSTKKQLKHLAKGSGIGLCFGYPHSLNSYEWFDDYEADITHQTNVIRKILPTTLDKIDGEYFLKKLIESIRHEEFSGMSGGIITCLNLNEHTTKAIGMIISGGNDIIRFIPFYILYKYIYQYKSAKSMIIDELFEKNAFAEAPEKFAIHLGEVIKYYKSKGINPPDSSMSHQNSAPPIF